MTAGWQTEVITNLLFYALKSFSFNASGPKRPAHSTVITAELSHWDLLVSFFLSTRWCLCPQNPLQLQHHTLHDCTLSLWYIVSCEKFNVFCLQSPSWIL